MFFAGHYQYTDHPQYYRGLNNAEKALHGGAVTDHYSADAERESNTIYEKDRADRLKAQIDKIMMEMVLTAVLQPLYEVPDLAFLYSHHRSEYHIEDGHPEHHDGYGYLNDIIPRPVADQPDTGENETQERAARLAQEDLPLLEIIRQERDTGSDEADRQ